MPEGIITTRQKILQVIVEKEEAGSIFTIVDVAKEAGVANSTIHNRYPDLAARIRTSSGVAIEKDVKKKLAKRLGTIKEEKAKRLRLRDELDTVKKLLCKVNSVNVKSQFENVSLKAENTTLKVELEKELRKHRTQVAKLTDTVLKDRQTLAFNFEE